MKNKDFTPAEWEKIIINRAFGMSNAENAKAMELTNSGVQNVLNAFDCVKEQDWARACNLIVSRSMNIEVFKWSAEKCGVELPEIVVKAYEDYKQKRRAEKAAKMAEAQKAPEPVLPPAQQDDNNRLFFIRMLENMVKLNELMEQLMDVVIPKYVGDMKDNLNVNADVICACRAAGAAGDKRPRRRGRRGHPVCGADHHVHRGRWDECCHSLETVQAVDAVEVVHGRWKEMHYEGGILDGTNFDRCSICGYERVFDDLALKTVFKYCPKCGTRMDEEDNT